jgi:hypothetical protein
MLTTKHPKYTNAKTGPSEFPVDSSPEPNINGRARMPKSIATPADSTGNGASLIA